MAPQMAPAKRLELLQATGEALYGPAWQSPLARALGVNLRRMQRWAAGTAQPPIGVLHELAEHCRERAALIESARRDLVASFEIEVA